MPKSACSFLSIGTGPWSQFRKSWKIIMTAKNDNRRSTRKKEHQFQSNIVLRISIIHLFLTTNDDEAINFKTFVVCAFCKNKSSRTYIQIQTDDCLAVQQCAERGIITQVAYKAMKAHLYESYTKIPRDGPSRSSTNLDKAVASSKRQAASTAAPAIAALAAAAAASTKTKKIYTRRSYHQR